MQLRIVGTGGRDAAITGTMEAWLYVAAAVLAAKWGDIRAVRDFSPGR